MFTIPFHGGLGSGSGESGGRLFFLLFLESLFGFGFGALAGCFPFLERGRSGRALAERFKELTGALFGLWSECGRSSRGVGGLSEGRCADPRKKAQHSESRVKLHTFPYCTSAVESTGKCVAELALARPHRVQNPHGCAVNPTLQVTLRNHLVVMERQVAASAKFSVFAIIAIVAAILSFVTGPVLGLVFALVAILFGVIGMVSATRSSVRGGFTGMLSILAGIIGIVAAVVKALMWLF